MNIPNTAFVKFHNASHLPFILMLVGFFFSVLFILAGFFFYGVLLLFTFLCPAVLLEAVSKRRLLPRVREETANHKALKESGISWLLRVSGRGVHQFNRVEVGLPRTIADQSMVDELSLIAIPSGLVEPELVRNSKPGSTIGSIFAVVFSCFFLMVLARITQSTAQFGTKIFAWCMIPIFIWVLLVNVLSVPVLQKSTLLPAFWRCIGRGQAFRRAFVVGPGWVKFGNVVWNANTDALLIRRHGFRSARASLNCMLVSKTHSRRITFSGLHDEDFRTLFGYWNVDEVRLEFVDSELS